MIDKCSVCHQYSPYRMGLCVNCYDSTIRAAYRTPLIIKRELWLAPWVVSLPPGEIVELKPIQEAPGPFRIIDKEVLLAHSEPKPFLVLATIELDKKAYIVSNISETIDKMETCKADFFPKIKLLSYEKEPITVYFRLKIHYIE